MDLRSYIKTIDVSLPNNFLEDILREYELELSPALVSNEMNRSVRDCQMVNLSTNLNNEKRKYIDNTIFYCIRTILEIFERDHPFLSCTQDSGYELVQYKENGHCLEHVDVAGKKNHNRLISVSIPLNDDFEGGQLGFWKKAVLFENKKNQAIAWPSNSLYPHSIRRVIKGERYVIVAWGLF